MLIKSLPLILLASINTINVNSVNYGDFINPKEAEITSKIIYVDLSHNDKFLDSANTCIRFGDKNNPTQVNLIEVSDDIYKVETSIPLEVFKNETLGFEVYSFDLEYKSIWINGNNKLKEANYNYICLSEYIEDEDALIEGYGIYGDKVTHPEEATYETQRIWINDDIINSYKEITLAVGYSYQNKWNILLNKYSLLIPTTQRTYFYFDIPYEVNSIHFYRISNEDGHDYLIYQDYDVNGLTYGVCYYSGTSYEDFDSIKTTIVFDATADILKSVVEAYLTLGKDDSNGSTKSTITNIKTTWWDNKAASTDALKATKLLDYTGYAANNNSYVGLKKSVPYSVYEKWSGLTQNAGIASSNFNLFSKLTGSSLFPYAIIGGVSLVVVILVLILMIQNRKRHFLPFI